MNSDTEKKLDQLLAKMPRQQYDTDAWLVEDETSVFDSIVRQRRRKRLIGRWAVAAAFVGVVCLVGVKMHDRNTIPLPPVSQTIIRPEKPQTPTLADLQTTMTEPVDRQSPKRAYRKRSCKPVAEIPDTLGSGIWKSERNVLMALQVLCECEEIIAKEEQAIRNGMVKASYNAMPQPETQLVVSENGDYHIVASTEQSIIEI